MLASSQIYDGVLLFGLLDPLDGKTADINVNLLAGAANGAAKLWKDFRDHESSRD